MRAVRFRGGIDGALPATRKSATPPLFHAMSDWLGPGTTRGLASMPRNDNGVPREIFDRSLLRKAVSTVTEMVRA